MRRPARIDPVVVRAQGLACAAGIGLPALASVIDANACALVANEGAAAVTRVPLPTWIGRVAGLDAVALPPPLRHWDCRATRLTWAGLKADGFSAAAAQAIVRHGATRVGLALGTSASTIAVSERAYRALEPDGGFPVPLRQPRLNTPHALALFVQEALGLQGPCVTVSTACSSSAKVFAVAERWLRLDLADAVVVAGVDALCDSVLFGFHALGLVSPQPCRPFGEGRSGINVGEAAAFALLEREGGGPRLLGYGESNDAHHMSSPHPLGLGAERALDDALARAGVDAAAIDYLNLHGTASARNDEVEAALVARRYAEGVHASATKGVTGHTMGAAGLVEALVCLHALETGRRAGSPGSDPVDPALGAGFAAQLKLAPATAPTRLAASHSFGFGGNNAVLIFGTQAR